MNGYAFAAEIIKAIASLAWPAALVVCVWIFRNRLTALLPHLRVKHKDWEASFRLDEAEKEAKSLPPPEAEAPPTPEEQSRFDKIAKLSPRTGIVEYRLEVEQAVREFAKSVGMEVEKRPYNYVVRDLRKNDLIDNHTSAILDDLRSLGTSALHSPETIFTYDDALRFRDLAERVISQLRITTAAATASFQSAVMP